MDRKIAHGSKLKKNITSSRWRHETSHNFSLENAQFPYKPLKNIKIRIWEIEKSPQIESLILTSLSRISTNLLRTPIQWPTRSLWSWPDSHTNPWKIAKNEISQNQKSARTERSLLTSSSRMWRNLLRIPIQWPTQSLLSWSDSHTNPLKVTKNEISRNQKSPPIERYFLRPSLWIRRDFPKIPI